MIKIISFGDSGNKILQKYAKMSGYSDIDKYCLNSNKDLKIIESIKNVKALVVGGLGGSSTKLLYQALPKLKDNNCKVAVLATMPFEVEECNRLLTALSTMDFIEETANESIIVPCDSFLNPKKTVFTLDYAFDCVDAELVITLDEIIKNIKIKGECMKDLKQTLKRQIEQLEIENIFHRNINRYIKKLSNREMTRHIEEVGKCTQKIEEALFKLLGITVKLPIELIEIDEETKAENAIMPKDEAYKMARFKTKKISRLFKENNY